jgi:hypothetical protein
VFEVIEHLWFISLAAKFWWKLKSIYEHLLFFHRITKNDSCILRIFDSFSFIFVVTWVFFSIFSSWYWKYAFPQNSELKKIQPRCKMVFGYNQNSFTRVLTIVWIDRNKWKHAISNITFKLFIHFFGLPATAWWFTVYHINSLESFSPQRAKEVTKSKLMQCFCKEKFVFYLLICFLLESINQLKKPEAKYKTISYRFNNFNWKDFVFFSISFKMKSNKFKILNLSFSNEKIFQSFLSLMSTIIRILLFIRRKCWNKYAFLSIFKHFHSLWIFFYNYFK